ncbi:hypothetical protein, partial [Mesorhizobium sp.]|uniref:hypothetical protein n=1 Tax=Mesorhizobium sp. TaxID=1871066 RepID=UPI00257D1BD6
MDEEKNDETKDGEGCRNGEPAPDTAGSGSTPARPTGEAQPPARAASPISASSIRDIIDGGLGRT